MKPAFSGPVEVKAGDGPVVLGMPHTGTWLPANIASRLNANGRLLADTDWHIDRLYGGLLPHGAANGATVVRAIFHRYCIDANRARVFACAEAIMAIASRSEEGRLGGQNDLFGEAGEEDLPHAAMLDWLPAERLSREYEAIGSFLTGHPIDAYQPVLKKQAVTPVREFEAGAQSGTAAARIAGIVVSKQIRRTRSGGRLAVIGLSDPSGQVECVAFSEALGAWAQLTEIGTPVIANVVVDRAGDMPRYRIQDLKSLEDVAAKLTHALHIHVTDSGALDSIRSRLNERGDGEVSLFLHDGHDREVEMRLKTRYAVTPQLAAAIKAIPGVDEAVYH